MIHYVFSVRDSASEAFAPPFCQAAVGQAVRSFSDAVNTEDKGNALSTHPEDFILYQLGTFDDSTGLFHCSDQPGQLARAVDVKVPK